MKTSTLMRLASFTAAFGLFSQTLLSAARNMQFLDVLRLRTVSNGTLSADGKVFAYEVSSLDWKSGRRQSDIYVTSAAGGPSRQLTFSAGHDETAPLLSPDGRWIAFLSDRETAKASQPAAPSGATPAASARQLYLISPTGGEARKISDQPGGVGPLAFSRDGKWLAFAAGRPEARQLFVHSFDTDSTTAITKRTNGIVDLAWDPNSTGIYFTSPDRTDPAERRRMEAKFDVRIANQEQAPRNLWRIGVDGKQEERLTSSDEWSIVSFRVSSSGRSISYNAQSANRWIDPLDHEESEVFLLDTASRKSERVTSNAVKESNAVVSPDGKWIAIAAPQDFQYFRRNRLLLRATTGGEWRTLAPSWEGDLSGIEWSAGSDTIFFRDGVGLNNDTVAVEIASGNHKQLTARGGAAQAKGVIVANYHEESNQFILRFENATSPADYFLATPSELASRDSWRRMSDANPGIRDFALGEYEAVRWKSSDGEMVEGILVKPIGFDPSVKYPLIVQLHGGPASAYTAGFSGSYGTYVHVFAAAGYAVLQPNYRGSTNYGEKFRTQIAGDYFRQAFDDIMTGVDAMIARGVADPGKLGLMGWSAGGHWSNWALTHTDRFKAISTGAGASNWISMYAQTDVRRVREHYFQGTPYDNWDHFVAMSPLRYIKNAKTPTLIHVGHDDARVPRPQSEELYVALKKLGVPAEFIVYPRMGHGITEPRYQMVKMAAEFNWFEKWIKGKKEWLDWKALLDTLPEGGTEAAAAKSEEPKQ